jgi:general secretion pathway protein G
MMRPMGRRVRYRRRRELRGFTLVELMIAVTIIGILATQVMDRLLYYREFAEKAAMDATLAATKMGLQIRLAELIMTNRQKAGAQLEHANPMLWLETPPPDYVGEYRAPATPGNWYFAADAEQLVYAPKNTSYLQLNHEGNRELRFQVRLYYDELDTAGAKIRSLTGVNLLPVYPYRWF